jgi:O-antigen ligase
VEKLYSLHIRTIIDAVKEEGGPFVLICIYLFFEYVRPQSIYPQLDVLPWVPFVLVLAILTVLVKGEHNKPSHPLNKLIVLYAIIVVASSLFSESAEISLSRLRVFFDWFLVYFLIIIIVNNEKRFFIFLLLFLLCSFKMSQFGFLTWANRGFNFTSWGVVGAPGWFHNSGEVGIQMCIYIPMSISFIFATYKHINKFWLFFFFLMPFTGLSTTIASSSRGALVGLSGSALWSILHKPKKIIISVFSISIVTFIIFLVMPNELKTRFNSAGTDVTSTNRLILWKNGIEAMNKHPFLGVGFEAWSDFYPRNFILNNDGTYLVHNVFIQCGTELGYLGLIVFVSIIFCCFKTTKSVRKMATDSNDLFLKRISYGFDAGLIGLIVSGSFVTVLYYPFFWIHFAITTCLHTAAIKKYHRNN